MKRKLFFIPLLASFFLLNSCGFSIIFTARITSLTISDANDNYVVGDIFDEQNKLSITAKYSDGKVKNLKYGSEELTVNLSYLSNNVKVNQDSSKPFSIANQYELVLNSNNIKSNALTINVLKEHVYVSNLFLSGDSEMETWQTISLTAHINPSNYTTNVTYSASNPNLVALTKTDSGVDVQAQKAGEVDIIVTSYSAKDVEISASHHIKITGSAQSVSMKQTYNDYVKHNVYNLSATPLTGSPKLLVIPVWLTDSNKYITNATNKENVRKDIESAYFGDEDEIGWYSVSSFYKEESQGRLNLTGVVSSWYECDYSTAQVGNGNFATKDLVVDAVNWFFDNNPSEKRSDYDSDNDNVLDGTILIYAAPDHTQTGFGEETYPNLWAYCFWIQKNLGGIYPNAFFWASYDFMYGSTNARARTGSNYYMGDTRHCTVDSHTYTHEMGHMFGLEDYYDYSGQYSPAGGFSMQDYNIGGHDPYSLLALGWLDAYIPTDSMTLTIRSLTEGHDLILLTPQFNTYLSPFDEYLLLELYTPTVTNRMDSLFEYMSYYPTGSNKAGIRLWHVDARLAVNDGYGTKWSLSNSANVNQNRITTAFKNTYYSDDIDAEYLTVLGSSYYDYDILHLIRNNRYYDYKLSKDTTFNSSDLFYTRDSFDMNRYRNQFVKNGKLDSGIDLEWSFVVDSITTDLFGKTTATITLTRE